MNEQQKADVILSSNAVFTGIEDGPKPASIAISKDRIIAVGSEEEMKPYIDENTKLFQYENQLIMPGFHDFHIHLISGSIALNGVNLFDARSEEEAVEMVQQYAESRPDEPWIVGYSWDAGYWDNQQLPHRSSLDRVFPDRPVLLSHAEGHYSWVNSKALEMANIDRNTKNPPFGLIEKDEDGELTGILYEQAAKLVRQKANNFSEDRKKEFFRNFLTYAASVGVTSINDMYSSGTIDTPEYFEFLKGFEEDNELTVRVHLYPPLNGNIEFVKQMRETYQSDKLRVSGLKQFIDGVITARTAYMLEPYADQPDTRGDTAFPPDTIKKWVVEADKEGFSIRFHSIGDGAIRLALDAYEEAQKINGVRDSRHSVEHVEVIHPDDIPRFKELGVIASMQPDHFAQSERGVYTTRIGDEREKYVFVINTLQKAGAKLAFGTDFPIDILDPLLQIYRAVTRIDSSGKDIWHPEERITLAEALKAYTATPAYGTFREDELGSLEAGKRADIVVLDRNLFEIPAEEIRDAKVSLTMMDGKVVYDEKNNGK